MLVFVDGKWFSIPGFKVISYLIDPEESLDVSWQDNGQSYQSKAHCWITWSVLLLLGEWAPSATVSSTLEPSCLHCVPSIDYIWEVNSTECLYHIYILCDFAGTSSLLVVCFQCNPQFTYLSCMTGISWCRDSERGWDVDLRRRTCILLRSFLEVACQGGKT